MLAWRFRAFGYASQASCDTPCGLTSASSRISSTLKANFAPLPHQVVRHPGLLRSRPMDYAGRLLS